AVNRAAAWGAGVPVRLTATRRPTYRTPAPAGRAPRERNRSHEISSSLGLRPLSRHLPGDGLGLHVPDRPHPHLLRDALVPLHVRRALGRAPRLGPGRLRAPRLEAAPRLLLRQGRRPHPALRRRDPVLPLPDRPLPVPPRPADLLFRDLPRALLP